MTQEIRRGLDDILSTYQQEVGVAGERAGVAIKEGVRNVLSVYKEDLPPELILCGAPDVHLNMQTYELVNTSSQRPRPLSDIAWFVLRDKIVFTLEGVISKFI